MLLDVLLSLPIEGWHVSYGVTVDKYRWGRLFVLFALVSMLGTVQTLLGDRVAVWLSHALVCGSYVVYSNA